MPPYVNSSKLYLAQTVFSMIPRLHINLLQAVLFSGLLFPSQSEVRDVHPFSVDLAVFEGHKSLLLAWSYSDTIDARTITIKSKSTIDLDYRIIQKLEPERSRYLIQNCEIGLRYFYLIEIEDYLGNLYSSDRDVPVFGSCMLAPDTIQFDPDISTVEELILAEIYNRVQNMDPTLNINPILPVITSTRSVEIAWLEEIPFNVLKDLASEISAIEEVVNHSTLLDSIMEKEVLYRNQVLVTPNEWLKKIKNSFSLLSDRWRNLFNEYEKSLMVLSQMPPIHILGAKPLEDGQKDIVLQVVHEDQVDLDESYLLYRDEYLDLSSFAKDSSGFISILAPINWAYTDLMINGIFHQRFPLWITHPVSKTMQGDLLPGDDIYTIKVGPEPASVWFNEMIWSPKTMKLDLEASGVPDFDEHYAFILEDQFIWELDWEPGFEIQYRDSSILLDQAINFPVLLSWNKWDDDQWEPIEYMILDSLPMAINRFPDGKSWTELTYSTLGSTNDPQLNDINTELIPQLFVLYQNYPNPFNGLTRLTFDLLEDATVSLYVTDATGRVRDVFVEGQFMTGGTYNFEWSGENRSTGIYFFTIHAQAGNFSPAVMSRKMIYLK